MVALTQSIATLFIASMLVSCWALTQCFSTIEARIAANVRALRSAGHLENVQPGTEAD